MRPKKPNLAECRNRIIELESRLALYQCALAWNASTVVSKHYNTWEDDLGIHYTATLLISPKAYNAIIIIEANEPKGSTPTISVNYFDRWYPHALATVVLCSDERYKAGIRSMVEQFRLAYDAAVAS